MKDSQNLLTGCRFDVFQIPYQQGLPNLSNTCYINSIIQLLYSSVQFKNHIRYLSMSTTEQSLSHSLNKIFSVINANGSLVEKQASLKRLIRVFHRINSEINYYSQQDALQILMMILNQLFIESSKFIELFQAQLQNRCECNFNRTASFFILNPPPICLNCQSPISINMVKYPSLLLVKSDQISRIQGQNSKYLDDRLIYRCRGKIFYVGDTNFGHYRASRLHNNKFVELSDLQVYQEINDFPYLFLYQRVTYSCNVVLLKPISNNLMINQSTNLKTTIKKEILFDFVRTEAKDQRSIEMQVKNQCQQNDYGQVFKVKKMLVDCSCETEKLIESFLIEYQQRVNNYLKSKFPQIHDNNKDEFYKTIISILKDSKQNTSSKILFQRKDDALIRYQV